MIVRSFQDTNEVKKKSIFLLIYLVFFSNFRYETSNFVSYFTTSESIFCLASVQKFVYLLYFILPSGYFR